MNPYRQAPAVPSPVARFRKPRVSWRRRIAGFVALASFLPFIAQQVVKEGSGNPRLVVVALAALLVLAFPTMDGADAKTRLCRILWNRGERGTAFGVYIGWIPLRFSQQRMDRNARALRRFVAQRRRERRQWVA